MTTLDIAVILTVLAAEVTTVCLALRKAGFTEIIAAARRQRARERLDRERRRRLRTALKPIPDGSCFREEAADGSTFEGPPPEGHP